MSKFRQQIVSNASQVPVGYIAATDFLLDRQKVLSKAALNGEIPSAKVMRTANDIRGAVYYEGNAAFTHLNLHFGASSEGPRPDAAATSNPTPASESGAVSDATHELVISVVVNNLTEARVDQLGRLMGGSLHDDLLALMQLQQTPEGMLSAKARELFIRIGATKKGMVELAGYLVGRMSGEGITGGLRAAMEHAAGVLDSAAA